MVKAAEATRVRVFRKLRSAKARRGTRHWDYGPAFDPEREKKDLDPDKVFDLEREREAFEQTVGPEVLNVFQAFGEEEAEALGVSFDMENEAVTADILNRSNRLKDTVDTTWNKVAEAIADGERNGETIDEIAARIGRVFEQAKGYRARVIARTETVGAANAGSFNAALQSGVVKNKVWLATSDHRTRSTHVAADGQSVGLKKKFRVGTAKMEHPGDPAGGAAETINCRCTMIYERTEPKD